MVKLLAAVWLASIASCLEKNATYWAPYNATDDSVEVAVGRVVGDDVVVDLSSTTGATLLGEGRISPGSGPVGTEHMLSVMLDDGFEADVGRVTAEANSARGLTVHEFDQDSADPALWMVSVTSLGEPDEVRDDTFRFVLWQLSDKDDPDAVKVE